ncbi:MAG: DUF3108 domain-containing protein [Gammaproteobacteria bacterium]
MSFYIKPIILASCLFLSGLVAAADSFPDPFEASYSLHSRGYTFAKMKRSVSRLQDGTYLYHSETNTTGLVSLLRNDHIEEQSTWFMDEDQLKPLRYSYLRSGGKKDRDVTVQFDWASGQITNSVNGAAWRMPIQPAVMDKLLYQLAIMHDLDSGKEQFSYTIADGGKIKIYNFDILGEEPVKTPLGEFATVKLKRIRKNSKHKTTFWCARELGYLPVRVENISKDGRKTVAILESFSGIHR